MYINNPVHMTKMTATPIYCTNPLKSSFLERGWGRGRFQRHLACSMYYNVNIDHDPVIILTYCRENQHRSQVSDRFPLGYLFFENAYDVYFGIQKSESYYFLLFYML